MWWWGGGGEKEAFHQQALFPIRLQCSKFVTSPAACSAEVFKGEWSHFNLAAVSPVNPKAQLLGPVIWYSWWLTAKYSPTGIIFHRILQGHRKLREAFTWRAIHIYTLQAESILQLKRKWRSENGLHIYKCTSTVIHLDYPPWSLNLNNLLFIHLSVGLLSTYLTEFWEPVPSHLAFASGLARDWRLN